MSIELTEADKIKILNADDLYGIMQKILLREDKIDQDREHFWVVGFRTWEIINCRINLVCIPRCNCAATIICRIGNNNCIGLGWIII